MPLTMNVGLSRKVGEANYGSRGASVSLQIELESSLVREPDQLHEKIRYLFRLARQAVDEQLAAGEGARGNGQTINGNGVRKPPDARPATAGQLRAIHAIAERSRIDLAAQLREQFGVLQPHELTVRQASDLIDHLQSGEPEDCP